MAVTHLPLEFFGTVVGYSAMRNEVAYSASHQLVCELGAIIPYDQFVRVLDWEFAQRGSTSGAGR